jgi:hypothetical protein
VAEEETVLQGMIDRLIEIGRYHGMEMNVETDVISISNKPSPLQVMVEQKQLDNVEYFNYLASMITNDARCTREIKSRIAMAKAALNRKKTLLGSKLDLNLGEKTSEMLRLEHSFVC